MKRLLFTLMLVIAGLTVTAQTHSLNYWFDGDYTSHSVSTSATGAWNLEIDITQLRNGFHSMYLQVTDTAGRSNMTRSFLFYHTPTADTMMQGYRYWFDNDYATMVEGQATGNVLVDVSALRDGFHTLFLSMIKGRESELRSSLFYKVPMAQADDSVVTWWFDGMDSAMTTRPIGDGLVMIDVADLSDTTHTIYLVVGRGRTAQQQSYEFLKVPVVYNVTLASADSTMGSVSGGGDYPRHSTATIAATAEYGYLFSHWSDGDTNALRSIYLTQDTALTAYFVPDTFSFDIAVGDTTMGTVIVSGDGSYLSDDTATAVPNYGYHFVGWSDGDTTNPRVVTLTQDTVLTAIFAPNVYTVTLASENPEWGSAIGSGEYEYLTVVPLEAVAVYGYQFKQWNDGNTDNPRQLVVRGDTSLSAEFELRRYTLTVQSNDLTRGFTQGGGTFSVLDTATALAITLAGNSFLGWADGDMTNPRQLQLSSDTTLTAIFQALNSMPETIIVHDTTVVTDTLTLTLHDTTYIDIPVHDTTVLVDTLLVDHYIYDTIDNYIYVTDTVTMTEYVPVHDTTYIDVPVHDTTIVTLTDTVVNTVYDTVDNFIYDTTIVTDTLWLTLYDTVWMTDTVYIHDTVYVPENGIEGVETTNIRLYQRNGQIVVEDADGGVLPEVVVYDAVGRKMETGFAGGAPAYQFDVPASGVYLVKIGDRPARRIVVIR